MRRNKPKKTQKAELPFSLPIETSSTKEPTKITEQECKPWFSGSDTTPEFMQVNKYIESRFSEFQDDELINFLKNSEVYRKIVSEIRSEYINTEKKSQRHKAA